MTDNTTYNYDPNKLSDKEIDSVGNGAISTMMIIIILMFIWTLLGLVAFIMSIVCFARSGSTFEKVMGLLLALFLGPLYFLFFSFSNTYCK